MNELQPISKVAEQPKSGASDWKHHFTTVTPLSKALAMILFIALPFIGFILGNRYGETSYGEAQPIESAPLNDHAWREYRNEYQNQMYNVSFNYPTDWSVSECLGEFERQCTILDGPNGEEVFFDYVDTEGIANHLPEVEKSERRLMLGDKTALRADYVENSALTMSLITFNPPLEVAPFFHIKVTAQAGHDLNKASIIAIDEILETLTFEEPQIDPLPDIEVNNLDDDVREILNGEWSQYYSKEGGYAIEYPAGWTVRDNGSSLLIMNRPPLRNDVDVFNPTDSNHVLFTVYVDSNSSSQTLEDYYRNTCQEFTCEHRGTYIPMGGSSVMTSREKPSAYNEWVSYYTANYASREEYTKYFTFSYRKFNEPFLPVFERIVSSLFIPYNNTTGYVKRIFTEEGQYYLEYEEVRIRSAASGICTKISSFCVEKGPTRHVLPVKEGAQVYVQWVMDAETSICKKENATISSWDWVDSSANLPYECSFELITSNLLKGPPYDDIVHLTIQDGVLESVFIPRPM
jgi:hypothetical protein